LALAALRGPVNILLMRDEFTTSPRRRLSGLLLVGLLHVALIYALTQGLARKVVEVVRNPLEVKIVETVKPPAEQPPPLALPKLAPPPLPRIAPPEVKVQPPPALPAVAPKQAEPAPAPAPAAPAPAAPQQPAAGSGQAAGVKPPVPVRSPAVVDARACEKPRYPPASIRANETGTVLLNFLIDTSGKVLESRVERSSGYPRLDEAARNGLALCKFKPATVDGKPEQSWAKIEYEWKLVD
jgi:protein TonB